MDGVNKTLYIPLYGKAYVSKKGIILADKKAEEIWNAEGFPLKGKSKSKYLAYYMGIRSAVFDDWAKEKMAQNPDAVVLHIGCGMDSRVLRIPSEGHKWYDVDFPEVIEERKRYFAEDDNYRMLPCDASKPDWLSEISEKSCAIVIMEGISMYLRETERKVLTQSLCNHFGRVYLLMDCYSTFAARMSRYKNPINDVGVTQVYGMDDPTVLANGNFIFVCQHCMTPQVYIDSIRGMERVVFRKLYAGRFARKLYRLYEYQKT